MTTPPDIDRAAWNRSLDLIAAWEPSRLLITHWGSFDDVDDHIERTRAGLDTWGDLAGELDEEAWGKALTAAVAAATGHRSITGYGTSMPPATLWHGLRIERERLAKNA